MNSSISGRACETMFSGKIWWEILYVFVCSGVYVFVTEDQKDGQYALQTPLIMQNIGCLCIKLLGDQIPDNDHSSYFLLITRGSIYHKVNAFCTSEHLLHLRTGHLMLRRIFYRWIWAIFEHLICSIEYKNSRDRICLVGMIPLIKIFVSALC